MVLDCLVMEEATASLPIGAGLDFVEASTSSLLLLEQAPTGLLEAALQLLGGLRSLLHHLRLQICNRQRALFQQGRLCLHTSSLLAGWRGQWLLELQRLLEAWRGRAARLRPSNPLLWPRASAKELRQLLRRRLAGRPPRLLLEKDGQLPLRLRLSWVLEEGEQLSLPSTAQGQLPLGGCLLEASSISWLALGRLRMRQEPIRDPPLMALRLLGHLQGRRQPLQVPGMEHGTCPLLGAQLLL